MIKNTSSSMAINRLLIMILGVALFSLLSIARAEISPGDKKSYLTLLQVELIALENEPGLLSQQFHVQAQLEQSVADGQKMDPKLSIGLLNLPTDSYDFDQEPVTQLKLSYIQQFPSGDSLEVKKQNTLQQSEMTKIDMALRQLDILRQVRLAYLEVVYLEKAKKTIQKNTKLFEQLVGIVQSLFSVGRNKQQDLIRAQLGVSRLDDRLAKIDQQINNQRSILARWIGVESSLQPLADDLPQIISVAINEEFEDSRQLLLSHPRILKLDKQLLIARNNIQMVEESLKPGYTMNFSYAYRDDAQNGTERADFLSAAITFDLPIFTDNRQDRNRLSKENEYQSLKNKRLEQIQQLASDYQQQYRDEILLTRRKQLFEENLLPQSRQQSQATLLAYQSDRASFSDVMRSYMDELDVLLDVHRINIDILKTRTRLQYLLPVIDDQNL
jgi:outer membrane protein TolC